MPDPTPTPDTLRAAIERALTALVRLNTSPDQPAAARAAYGRASRLVRAALAASPAPTDTPDQREHTHIVGSGSSAIYPYCPACGTAPAAAPAVERATPDPDTLARLLADGMAEVSDGAGVPPDELAAYLIAAGVTLNETATTPTQEDA